MEDTNHFTKKVDRKSWFDLNKKSANLIGSVGTYDYFMMRGFEERKLYLRGDIDQCSVEDFVCYILRINNEDKDIPVEERKPITLFISSNGGVVDAGFMLCDVIMQSKTPVIVVATGYVYSMGFLIALSGHKRYAFENTKYLMHDGNTIAWDSTAKAHDRMRFSDEQEEVRTRDYVLSHSNITKEEYDAQYRKEWWMYADEAKMNGFVDGIIGKDIELDEVV